MALAFDPNRYRAVEVHALKRCTDADGTVFIDQVPPTEADRFGVYYHLIPRGEEDGIEWKADFGTYKAAIAEANRISDDYDVPVYDCCG
jgi:hypothetical protein